MSSLGSLFSFIQQKLGMTSAAAAAVPPPSSELVDRSEGAKKQYENVLQEQLSKKISESRFNIEQQMALSLLTEWFWGICIEKTDMEKMSLVEGHSEIVLKKINSLDVEEQWRKNSNLSSVLKMFKLRIDAVPLLSEKFDMLEKMKCEVTKKIADTETALEAFVPILEDRRAALANKLKGTIMVDSDDDADVSENPSKRPRSNDDDDESTTSARSLHRKKKAKANSGVVDALSHSTA